MKYLMFLPAVLCITVWALLVAGLSFYYSLREGMDEVVRAME